MGVFEDVFVCVVQILINKPQLLLFEDLRNAIS